MGEQELRPLHRRHRWRLVGTLTYFFKSFAISLLIVGNRSQGPPLLNLASLPSILESNSPTCLTAPGKAHGTDLRASFTRAKLPAGILINLAEGASSAGPTSVVNSFNRTKTRISNSNNNSSVQWRGEYVSPGGDDLHDDKSNFPLNRAPGSSWPHSEWGTNESSVVDITYPATPTSPLHDRPSSLPGALPHLFDALYADLDCVTHLLETRTPSARDLDDITYLIKVAAAFRERLQQAGPGRQEFTSTPSPTFHASHGPIYTHMSSHETSFYPEDRHFHRDAQSRAPPHDPRGNMTLLPPTSAPHPKSPRRGFKHPTLLNIVFRPLIALVGPTKGRNLSPSYHCLEPSGGHSHP